MRSLLPLSVVALAATMLAPITAHGTHDQTPISADASGNWADRHMAEEHHITSYDPSSFFNLHDFDSSGTWSASEIARMYGLMDESAKKVPEETKAEVVRRVLEIFDHDRSGGVSFAEWVIGVGVGKVLPDFGLGPGHHGDDEYEYEIHHYEKYHDDNTREEDLTHPEDIAHFKKHDLEDQEAERQQKLDAMSIVEANIPAKFRREP